MSTDRNPFPDEAAHLIQMNEKLEEALKKAEENVRKLDRSTGMPRNIWWTTGEKSTPMKCSRMNCF